ncbi:alanine--tRNA ligase, partial [Myxococcota bacterium]|nr:alanine--tRNA ligase [Myxococcota bacterium]
RVDEGRRYDIMANHTATHILHWALRQVLGDHATQQGSAVEPDKLRFDFTHHSRLTPEEISRIEWLVNEQAMGVPTVNTSDMDIKQARETGAMAIFGEKYGERVRVVSVGDFSRELCGGTHLSNAGQMGSFFILEESALSAGVRRIVAITRRRAYQHTKALEGTIEEAASLLKAPKDQLLEKIQKLQEQFAALKTEGDRKEQEGIKSLADKVVAGARRINNTMVITAHMPDLNRSQASELTDLIRSFNMSCAGLLVVSDKKDNVSIITFASKDLKKVHAGNLLRELAPIIGGKGGGRPDFAQGGAPDGGDISALLKAARDKFDDLLK